MTDLLDPWPSDDGERASEGSLRPRKLEEFVGQARIREQLGIVLESARRRGLPPDALRRAVSAGDADALTLVPGVGRKGAARLILELKGKLGEGEPDLPADTDGRPAYAEVREALGALGYGPAEIKTALAALPPDAGTHSTEELLRMALRGLGTAR